MRIKVFFVMLLLVKLCIAQIPANLDLVQVAIANSPVGFVSAHDGTGRMFIIERSGVIKILKSGVVLPTPFLDISSQVATMNEQGLLGLAFSPDYVNDGHFYVFYSFDLPGAPIEQQPLRLARFAVSNNPDVANATSMEIITDFSQNFSYHNGGHIAFGWDGYLYIGMGDDGDSNASQDLSSVKGKMLRLDVSKDLILRNNFDGDSGCGYPQNYLIPNDNPFINTLDACQSVYLSGLRNPWRWSFDSLSGHLYIGDVGGNREEEVSEVFIPNDAGANLGWPCIEGGYVHRQSCVDKINNLINPFFTYSRISGQGQSVVGGYVYRGTQISDLNGMYIFNDIYREEFYFSEKSNSTWQTTLWNEQVEKIVAYGEDEDGELYFISFDGPIYQLIQN